MKIVLCIISLFAVSLFKAQSTDSLLYQLTCIENDTESVNQLYGQGFSLRNTDPSSAQQFADACYKKANKSGSAKHLAKAFNLLGILNYKQNHYSEALQFQTKALKLNQSINNLSGCAINLSNLGNIYSDINYFSLAESSYLEALQLNNKLGNTKEITRCLINIAALNHTQKQNEIAVLNLKMALIYANNIGDYELIATCNNNIGVALVEDNILDTALLYFQDALKMRTIIDDEVDLANSYINIANVLVKQKQFSEAQNYISLAENACNTYQILDEMVILYQVKADFYEAQSNFQLANEFLKKHQHLKDSLTIINNQPPEIINAAQPELTENNQNLYSIKTVVFITLAGIFLSTIISYFLFRKK